MKIIITIIIYSITESNAGLGKEAGMGGVAPSYSMPFYGALPVGAPRYI